MDIAIVSADHDEALAAADRLQQLYPHTKPGKADVIVAIGGDGFLLKTLHQYRRPVFGLHKGTLGFLLNPYDEHDLFERLERANRTTLHPLHVEAETEDGTIITDMAVNELSMLRASPQAAKLKITVDGRMRMEQLVCDGILVATPAGSTAYNLSAHGPIIPLGSNVLALTPISPFRPRRWRGALLPHKAEIRIDVLKPEKRPVMASADDRDLGRILSVKIREDNNISLDLLYDPERHLEERILQEQFEP